MNHRGASNGAWKWKNLRDDFFASIVVFLVALPLCMGIAIASGAPVAAGLITGIVGGLVVGVVAGAPFQVSGPAAGLTVVVYDVVQRHGLVALGAVVLIAGAIQLAAGVFRLGNWFRAVSPAVVKGMLSGIGILIVSSQFHVMVDDRPRENSVQNILTIPEALSKGLPLPHWGTPESRQARATFLKEFGALHEKQLEVRELVEERVTVHGSAEEHAEQGASLVPIADREREVVERLRELLARVKTANLENGDDPKGLKTVDLAEVALADAEAALAEMQAGNGLAARESEENAEQSILAILRQLKNHDWATKIGLLTIAIIVIWELFVLRWLPLVPAPLVAVLLMAAFATIFSLPVLYVEVPERITDGIHFPSLALLNDVSAWTLMQIGLFIAVIASAETLLCATAVDQMHQGKRAKYDQELMAQGVGNMICGLLGALPMTGVIVRSAANIHAGAQSRCSAIFHGLWILVLAVFFGSTLSLIPTSCLAAILVYIGYKLINPWVVRELWAFGKSEVFIYGVTVVTIVVEDLLVGVLTGVTLSALRLLIRFSRLKTKLEVEPSEGRAVLFLRGTATFLRLPNLAAELEKVPPGAELHVHLEELEYVDHACLDLLVNWARQHESQGGTLVIDWDLLHARFGKEDIDARRITSHH